MVTEDYVSFEVAKLLEAKWFPINDFLEHKIGYYKGIPVSKITAEMIEEKMLSCIPQSVVMKWLRKVYKLHITIFSQSQESWMYRITKPGQKLEEGAYGEDFYSYEEACDSAIKYCLTNLI